MLLPLGHRAQVFSMQVTMLSTSSMSLAAILTVSAASRRSSRRYWPSTRRGTAEPVGVSAGGMAGYRLASCEGGCGLAERGGETGQGPSAARGLGVAFEPEHGR